MVLPLLLAGAALVLLGVFDLVKTVVNAEGGGGPVSSRVVNRLWRMALTVHRRRPAHGLLRQVGLAMILVTVLTWVLLLWAGWALVFASDPRAVVGDDGPADTWTRLYYAGDTLFTLGSGDFQPGATAWRVASTVTALMGLSLLSLGVAYLVPVVQAVSLKRQVAALVSALGGTPELLVERAWTGSDYRGLDDHLVGLTRELAAVRQSHFAYPALHYFHSLDAHDAFAPRLAALDDALTTLTNGVPEEMRPRPAVVEPVRHVIRSLLDTLALSFTGVAADAPPGIELGAMRERGLPFLDVQEVADAFAALDDRRRLLRGFVEHDGWGWPEAVCMQGELTGGAQLALDPSEHMASREEIQT